MRGEVRRITPLRALNLLRELERAGSDPAQWLRTDVKDALADHVKAGLKAKRRRRAKR